MKSQTHHIELKLNQIWTNPVCKIESWQNSTIGGWGECPYREINSFRSCLWNPCMHCLYYIYIYIVRTISKHHAELFFFFSFGSARRYCMGERKLLYIYIWWQRTRIIMLNFFLFVFYRSALYCMGERKSYMCNSGPKGSTMKQQTHVDTTKFTDTPSRIRFESDFNQSSVQNWIMTNYYH